ncbi:GMC oxidoreductase [Tolypocladium paradoxum]|uniref:GMC oxidoreductase n=1 Tax=Tolypocladium paradoxum TaxID=94208 RepID=A0A2S4KSG9_9HYPO|nr:GMC oxidoreductase [Tolypocladium paradoxum]
MSSKIWDYIVVGGGLSASVVSNRLLHLDPSLKILVVEAGPNANDDQDIIYHSPTSLVGGIYDWKYQTVPQIHLGNRPVSLPCGKGLGGGTVINFAGWIRGDKTDFDLWGETVGDTRWSYANQLRFMKQTENFSDTINSAEHGASGPMRTQTVSSAHREFPLRHKVLESWEEVGVEPLPHLDANAGNPIGIGDLCENRRQGRRQIASVTYYLEGVTVLTNTLVAKVLVKKQQGQHDATSLAYGIQLANGTEIHGKEIILSSGAIRTPQILMLSGIGPADELASHGIEVVLDVPEVGKNLADHYMLPTGWRIKDPSAGYAIGSENPIFGQPPYSWGQPVDFIVTTGVQDKDGLARAIEADEGVAPDPATHPLLEQDRAFNEHIFMYAGAPDGSAVSFMLISLLPTSRGSVTLASADISDVPLIDPNYNATEVDRFIARDGLRLQIRLAGTNATVIGRDILDGELGAPGFDEKLTADSTDEYIDSRVAAVLESSYHPMGTAAMGKVIDADLNVKGVANLRVVDSSVFPVAVTGHLQVAAYAMASQAAEIIHAQRGECKQ